MRFNGNQVRVVYDLKEDFKKIGAGRMYGKLYNDKAIGLQTFHHDICGALAKEYYDDLDIVNAHPTIMLKNCCDKGWTCGKLKFYVENRDDVLKDVSQFYNTDDRGAKQNCLGGCLVCRRFRFRFLPAAWCLSLGQWHCHCPSC
jgi:hypothetical protein